jgi:hypothetical protein
MKLAKQKTKKGRLTIWLSAELADKPTWVRGQRKRGRYDVGVPSTLEIRNDKDF